MTQTKLEIISLSNTLNMLLNRKNNQHRDNIIYLTGQPGDVLSPDPSSAEGVIIMSTYGEMQIILTVALLVVAILNLKNKK